jgi:putative endonuclease
MTNKPEAELHAKWHVYIIRCSDDSLYTGITTDIGRRFRQHAEGKGAKFFRGRTPLHVVYREENHSRSSAAGREFRIKSMNHAAKELMVAREVTRRQVSHTTSQV